MLIVAASTITGVVIKLPAGALSDVLGRSGLILFYTASYTTIYLIVGCLGLLPLFMVLRLPDDERPHVIGSTLGARSGQFWSGIQEVLSSHTVVLASALEAAMYVGYGAFLGFFPPTPEGLV